MTILTTGLRPLVAFRVFCAQAHLVATAVHLTVMQRTSDAHLPWAPTSTKGMIRASLHLGQARITNSLVVECDQSSLPCATGLVS